MIFIIVTYILIFMYGAVAGSFAALCARRVPAGESFITGRSRCESCVSTIKYYDLIPIASWLILRGKCRGCKASIGIAPLAAEIAGGILFCLAFLRFGVSWHAAVMCLFYAALITIFLADLSSHIIPDSLNVFVALLSAIAFLARWEGSPLDHVIGLFAVSLPLWAVAAVTKGFGGGDIKLFAVLGLMLGWKLVVLTAVLSFVIGGIAGIILLMTRRAASGTKIAFGPFICVSAVIASVWGDNIIGWYLGLP